MRGASEGNLPWMDQLERMGMDITTRIYPFRGSDFQLWQMCFLGATILFAFYREWEWPQTVFIVLHCLVLLMKQHSYAFYTGWLSNEYLRRQRLQKEVLEISDDNYYTDLTTVDSIAEERERLLHEIENADRDLTGTVLMEVTYPNNLRYSNFLDYMLCPTLIYELEYPRTNGCPTSHRPLQLDTADFFARIRLWYILEKAAATLGSIGLMIVITEQYVLPAVQPILPGRTFEMTFTQKFIELGWVLLDMIFPYVPLYFLN